MLTFHYVLDEIQLSHLEIVRIRIKLEIGNNKNLNQMDVLLSFWSLVPSKIDRNWKIYEFIYK